MLIDFTVANWMSYRDEAELNMLGSLERQHKETLAKLPGWRSKYALPVAAVYGGNASGKTALFKALAALKVMATVDAGTDGVLPVEAFRLDDRDEPTSLDATFLSGSNVYRLYVEATPDAVVFESLELVREKGESLVYERCVPEGGGPDEYFFGEGFFADPGHVGYAAQSTRGNRLFLESAVAQNVSELEEAHGWFADTLELVGVGSQAWSFATAAGTQEGFLDFAGEALSRLDTGISRLVAEPVGPEALPRDASLRRRIAELGEDEVVAVVLDVEAGDYGFEMLTVRSRGGKPEVQRLRTVHVGPDGREHVFSLGMESSGTQRLMGLLPMLFDIAGPGGGAGSKVYVVDELDRCMHTILTMRLVSDFLAGCDPDTRKQLMFTTHDLLLMDQSVMRRDEMYIAQRGTDGCSELVGLAEFKGIRFDKDLVRSYLDGRFGGIPMLGEAGARG